MGAENTNMEIIHALPYNVHVGELKIIEMFIIF